MTTVGFCVFLLCSSGIYEYFFIQILVTQEQTKKTPFEKDCFCDVENMLMLINF